MRSTGNTDDILSALKASRLFSGIGDTELSKFVECSGTVMRSYHAGCVILREGDIPCDIYVVAEGAVSLSRAVPNGRETFAEHGRGDSFSMTETGVFWLLFRRRSCSRPAVRCAGVICGCSGT